MWPSLSQKVWLLGVVITVASCGGGSIAEETADTSTTTSPSTTSTSTTTTSTTTTTLPPTTTSTTQPPTPAELRTTIITGLKDQGWVKHEDETGWSIWYPPDWAVAFEGDGDLGLISPGDDFSASVFVVSVALNAAPENEGSLDYLVHDATLAYEQDGLFQELDPESWYHLDFNLNGTEDLQDIYVFELKLGKDPVSGQPIPDESLGLAAPIWYFGYYDPEAIPSYGYIFQLYGTDATAFNLVDRIIYSFEPPGGVPGIDSD